MNMIDKMFAYNLWANSTMIELCRGLSEAQLACEVEGVFGRIKPTITHLIRGEGGYLRRLTGSRPWADDLDWDNMTFDDLLAKAQISGTKLLEIASGVDPEQTHVYEDEDGRIVFYNWTVVLQALYHGIEHRTQVKAILTHLGVAHPDFAAWDYVESLPPNR